jgi:hypothetical protein
LCLVAAFIVVVNSCDGLEISSMTTTQVGNTSPRCCTLSAHVCRTLHLFGSPDAGPRSENANSIDLIDASNLGLLVPNSSEAQVSQPSYLAVITTTAYRISTPYERIQFGIFVSSFQKRTEATLEKGKIYHIKGMIGDVCPFEKRSFRGSLLVIIVPAAYTNVVSPGKKYRIGIISVEERRRVSVTHFNFCH